MNKLIAPEFTTKPPISLLADINRRFEFTLGSVNLPGEDFNVTVSLNNAEPFMRFDEERMTFTIEAGAGEVGSYTISVELSHTL